MSKLRFAAGLVAGRLALNTFKLLGKDYQTDRLGYLPVKICPDFATHVARPKAAIAITGTNGKTSLTNLISDILKQCGNTVSCNNWGGNYMGGQSWAFLNSVNVFNKSQVDYIVMETDEGDSAITYPVTKPDYILINNIARDSIFKNPNPDFIMSRLRKAMEGTPESTLILNADDPVSCFLKTNKKNIYFGIADLGNGTPEYLINDFRVCPNCGGTIKYLYKNYGNIGKVVCPDCGLKSPEADYLGVEVANDHICIKEPDGSINRYPTISGDIYNAYNIVEAVALFRTLGIPADKIAEAIGKVKLPSIREERYQGKEIEVVNRSLKNSNGTAATVQFESLSKMKDDMAVILMLDEVTGNNRVEAITWMYDSDYELLNCDHIKQIIIGGERCLDHKLRCLLGGVDKNKISTCKMAVDTFDYLKLEGIKKVYILYDIYNTERSHAVFEKIRERID